MINEFDSKQYTCSPSDIAPSGPGYTNVVNQVCAIVGSESGERTLDGTSYLRALYGFESAHLWRNIGINAALFIAMAAITG